MTTSILIDKVKQFVDNPEGPADDMLAALIENDRNDIIAQSAIRFMIRVGAWRFERNGGFHDAMNHLFAHYDSRPKIDPVEYQNTTKAIIQEKWGYECVPIVTPPTTPRTSSESERIKPTRKVKVKTISEEEGESGSRIFKSINEQNGIDATGASDRLKKVIDIQRNN